VSSNCHGHHHDQGDKLKQQELVRSKKAIETKLLEQWEKLSLFVTSAEKKTGRKEVLDFISTSLRMTSGEEGLKREIGLIGLTSNIVNVVIGSGIFVLPAIVNERLGASGILAYLFCGFLSR